MTNETYIPNQITKDTVQKIDYLIQGVADGKFDEVAKKIEFMKKLGGDFEAPGYMQELLRRIDTLEEEKHELKGLLREQIAENINRSNEINDLRTEMGTVAKFMQWQMKPDPLASELYDIENLISKHGARKY